MKNISRIFIIFGIVVLALIALAAPLFAYTGATGMVIDSKFGQGWEHGADVYIEIITNPNNPRLISTCELLQPPDPDTGDFDCAYNSNDLNHSAFIANTFPDDGDTVRVTIDFTCEESGNCTFGNTEGTPATLQFTYVESTNLNFRNNLGYILTGTGPTAVELADINLTSESLNWSIVGLVGLLAIVTVTMYVIIRRRHVEI